MDFTPVILAHVVLALAAVVIGGLTLVLEKGSLLHRAFGRTWVLLVLATALISFGIQTNGHYSAVHLLSVFTLFGVSAALIAAIKGRISAHRRGMTATYMGLVIAGAFTLLPERRLGALLWGAIGVS